MDVSSAALSVIAVLALIYGLKEVAANGLELTPLTIVAGGLVTGYVFLRRQRGLDDPLVDIELFRLRVVAVAMSANGLGIFAIAGVFLFVTQYLQMVAGFSPLQAGLWTIPSAVALIVGSMAAPLVARFAKPAYAMALGLGTAAVGSAVMALVDEGQGVGLLVTGTVLICLGLAPVITLATDTIVSAAPPERAGSASSLSETCIELGGALGIAVLGSVGIAVYRTSLSDDLPADLSPEASLSAQETLGSAVHVSATHAGSVGDQVLAAAQSAFSDGLVVVSVLCCLMMAALAVAAAVYLRDVDAG
jgi:DHA2 family multidrug resistance protein-like MFS transporter